MHKNLLLLGGYNWFGFEIIDALIRENSFTHFIIVDCFENQLWKDSIKHKMDQYMHLYESDIFLYNYNKKIEQHFCFVFLVFLVFIFILYIIINIKLF